MQKTLSAAVLTVLLAVRAASGGTVEVQNFRGPTVDAFFASTDPSGCIGTDVLLSASGNLQGHSTAGSEATVIVDRFDTCNGTELLTAFGSVELGEGDLVETRRLTSAALTTNVEVLDLVSGTPLTLAIDLHWSGSGDLLTGTSHSHERVGPFIFNSRFSGSFREAEASGSVSDGTTNLTPEPSLFADISFANAGQVTVEQR